MGHPGHTPDLPTLHPLPPEPFCCMPPVQGGSGKALPWAQLQVPQQHAKRGWLLAGGLTPWNVAEAARTAHPTAVDVSSGVCRPDGLRKDHDKVAAFVTQAKQVTYKAGPEQT
jgi:phosphoribosylanthranilate isomerase